MPIDFPTGSGFLTLQADNLDALRTWEPRIRKALSQLPELTDVNTDQQDKEMQTSLIIDRDAAARLGVTVNNVVTTLNDAFGQRQVGVIYNPLNQYRVVMGLAPDRSFFRGQKHLNACMSLARQVLRSPCHRLHA